MIPAETCPQQKVIIRFSEMMHGKIDVVPTGKYPTLM